MRDAGPSAEIVAGTIERVTFHNVENGFCVLRVKARGRPDLSTVVGHAASISAGEWVTVTGEWVNDRTHGPQFRARFLRASAPTTAEGIEKYLASGMIRGIGPGCQDGDYLLSTSTCSLAMMIGRCPSGRKFGSSARVAAYSAVFVPCFMSAVERNQVMARPS